jgi:hypothetical protein
MSKIIKEENTEEDKKCVTFTYTGSYIRKTTKLFKETNLKVAFETTMTIGELLSDTHTKKTYEQSSIYKLTCQNVAKYILGKRAKIQ